MYGGPTNISCSFIHSLCNYRNNKRHLIEHFSCKLCQHIEFSTRVVIDKLFNLPAIHNWYETFNNAKIMEINVVENN